MDAVLDPLLQGGQIEKVRLTAASPFASPAFVVWKNDKPRIVVDMRKLNTKVIPNAYPLPRQDAILDDLGGSIIFSSMDITKGFFQQPVAAEDTWKSLRQVLFPIHIDHLFTGTPIKPDILYDAILDAFDKGIEDIKAAD
ncbi:hypothetical protein TEQG_01734 [Trichophyton equinum CBS 127.97]|uniref:Reverse transcriptase domain-containing protein n=1 Tax=Trichophyton equinum (strain ATCC MYA-4606 / CBS 127.97) TaxID=559882 RepID=F2PLA1_TRIEC|nr:hypothetical protein TEQG_01734 [Trichophyton equinum CBS 127.97]